MSVHRTFHALSRTPVRIVLAILVAAFVVGAGQVAVAVTEADVKEAASESRSASKELSRQERRLAKLKDDAADAAARQARAEVELKNAQTVAAGGEAPQKGLFGGLFGSRDPKVRLEKAQQELAEAKQEAAASRQAASAAEREVAASRANATAAAAKASQVAGQLEAAEAKAKAQALAKRRAMEDLQAAEANHARAEVLIAQLSKKLDALRAKVGDLGKRKIESIALVKATTEVATRAEDARERRKAVGQMRKAESEAAGVVRSLDEATYDVDQTMKKLESAELAAAQTRAELNRANKNYEPYQVAERAAAAAEARRVAEEASRVAAEKARVEAEKRAKSEAKMARIAEEKRAKEQAAAEKAAEKRARAEAKAQAEAAERQARSAQAQQQASAKPPQPLVTKSHSTATVGKAVSASEVVIAGNSAARQAQLDAERRKQEAELEKALVRQQAQDAARQAAADKASAEAAAAREKAEAEEKAAKAKAKQERDAGKIKSVEAERAERARQREAAANAVTHEGPYNELADGASARSEEKGNVRYDVCAVVVTGDREAVYELENWSDYENDALYQPMSDKDIESFRQRILKDLQDSGYVFATVSIFKPSLQLGFLKMRAHVGQQGEVTVKGNRWNSAKQILEAASWKTGSRFNYRQMYTDIFDMNVRPDVKINTKLKPRMDEFGNRIVDVEIDVEDKFPVHGSLNLANTGSKETSDWRLRSTLQHLNLTKNDDVLTLEWLTDPGMLQDVNAGSMSYHLPLSDNRSLTIYGGYSESDINDVMPELDVYGSGWYSGIQYTKVLKETKDGRYDLSYGWLYQSTRNSVDLAGQSYQGRDSQVSMPQVTIGYSDKDFDSLGGRNFWSNTVMGNFAGKFGSSDTDSFTQQNALSDGNFLISRFQFARFQRFFAGEDAPGKWSLFMKADGQLSDDSLIPSVQKGIGGTDSVRGYREREIAGDYGVNASIELRTPLMDNFIPGLERDPDFLADNPDHWSMHRLQFIMFGDYGMIGRKEPLPGEAGSDSLGSLGAGLRLGLTKYSQIRFDYGVPMEDSEESDNSGRGHLSLQVQF